MRLRFQGCRLSLETKNKIFPTQWLDMEYPHCLYRCRVSNCHRKTNTRLESQFSHLAVSDSLQTPWTAARQASLSITNSRSSLRLMSSESVMPSSYLILGRPHLLLPPIPPSIKVFSNESTLRMRWPKCWSFSFSIIPSKEIPGLISFRWTGKISLQSKRLIRVFSNTTVEKHQFFSTQLSL